MIRQKEADILDILRSQSSTATSRIGGGNMGDQSQSLGAGIGDQGQLLGAGSSNAETSLPSIH